MKHWKKICVGTVLVLFISLTGLVIANPQQEGGQSDAEPEENTAAVLSDEGVGVQEAVKVTLSGFAEQIYTYDTSERMF